MVVIGMYKFLRATKFKSILVLFLEAFRTGRFRFSLSGWAHCERTESYRRLHPRAGHRTSTTAACRHSHDSTPSTWRIGNARPVGKKSNKCLTSTRWLLLDWRVSLGFLVLLAAEGCHTDYLISNQVYLSDPYSVVIRRNDDVLVPHHLQVLCKG
jgi:hypothetical protein